MIDTSLATALASAIPARPLRVYPAVVSTEAAAAGWARSGAQHGSLVVAEYQAAARGRNGFAWDIHPQDVGFSLVLRPSLSTRRSGWLYTLATWAVATVMGERASIGWPDSVLMDGDRVAAVSSVTDGDPLRIDWAVVSVMLAATEKSSAESVAAVVDKIDDALEADDEQIARTHRNWLDTIGIRVGARLLPLGPNATVVEGEAVDTTDDGSLVIEVSTGSRRPLHPDDVGLLEML